MAAGEDIDAVVVKDVVAGFASPGAAERWIDSLVDDR
jgi:hypothetical protein